MTAELCPGTTEFDTHFGSSGWCQSRGRRLLGSWEGALEIFHVGACGKYRDSIFPRAPWLESSGSCAEQIKKWYHNRLHGKYFSVGSA